MGTLHESENALYTTIYGYEEHLLILYCELTGESYIRVSGIKLLIHFIHSQTLMAAQLKV